MEQRQELEPISLHVILSPASGTKYNIQGKITHKFISSHTAKKTTTTKTKKRQPHGAKRSPKIYIILIFIKN